MKDNARPDVKPVFVERNIPVVFATDENYLPYVKVAINSAIANATDSNLDFLILHSAIGDGAIQDFIARYAGLENVSVRFVDVSGSLGTTKLADFKQVDRLPISACFRLLVPDMLTAYDKIIYLDVDVSVCRDLAELYAVSLGDCYCAAANDVIHSTKSEYLEWAAGWGFTEWDGYVNTGVLIMNLERFRREPVLDRLLPVMLEASRWCCDQDALNFVCKGAIVPLDQRWNVQLGDHCLGEQLALTGDEMWIAHFTATQKPWEFPARRHSYLWWRHVDAADFPVLWSAAWGDRCVSPVAGMPKVSVIIPVYNAQLYLSEALASVLMQKEMPEIEVIGIDDGSTDDSAVVLELWKKLDPRLKVIRQTNQGAGVARNAGLDVAKGAYIFFLDADDRLSSGAALREAYEQSKADNLDVLIADGSIMSEVGNVERLSGYLKRNIVPEERVFTPDTLGADLFLIEPMGPAAKLFRRNFLDKRNLRFPALKRSEDFPMIQLALSLAERLGILQQPLFACRQGVATSLESTKDETPLIFVDAERIFRDALSERGLLDRFKRAADVSFLTNLAYNLRKVNRFSSFRAIAQHCVKTFPKLKVNRDEVKSLSFASSYKIVSAIVEIANNTDALADVFADVREAKTLRRERVQGRLAVANAKVARRDEWLAAANAKVVRRDEWLAAAKAKTARAEKKLAAAQAKLESEKAKVVRRDEWLTAVKVKRARAEEKLAAAQAKLEAANAKIVRRDKWLASEKAKTARAEKKLATAQTKLEAATAKVARRDKWLAAEKAKTVRAEKKLAAVQAKFEAENVKTARRDEWPAKERTKATKLCMVIEAAACAAHEDQSSTEESKISKTKRKDPA